LMPWPASTYLVEVGGSTLISVCHASARSSGPD
jgi:hypothetical protein